MNHHSEYIHSLRRSRLSFIDVLWNNMQTSSISMFTDNL